MTELLTRDPTQRVDAGHTRGQAVPWSARATAGAPHENARHHPHVPRGREHRGRARPGARRPPGGHPGGGRLQPRRDGRPGPCRGRAGPDRAEPAKQRRPGGAYAGFQRAFAEGYEVVVQMDADLSHPPTGSRPCSPRSTTGPTSPSAPATPRAAPPPTGRWCGSCCPGPATSTPRTCSASVCGTPPPGSGPTGPTSWRRSRPVPPRRRATGSSWSCRTGRTGSAAMVEVPITFSDRFRGVSKMSWRIIGEAMSLVTWWGLRDMCCGGVAAAGPGSCGSTAPRSPVPDTGGAAPEPEVIEPETSASS